MNAVVNRHEARDEQGFRSYVLSNAQVETVIVPELGARMISLKNQRTGREWFWHPEGGRRLFRNRTGDDFSNSPLIGLDECLPTVAPCRWNGQELPDHGEVWASPWNVDQAAWEKGLLRTSIRLAIAPFTFERTIELEDNELRFRYRLENDAATEESYLWAMHPLLRLQPGDRLELPLSTRALLNGSAWLDAVDVGGPPGSSEKIFASPLRQGLARIRNRETGDRLEFEWDSVENNTLGLWLTNGGWHGHHHFALEPANGEPDALSAAAQRGRCGVLAGHGSARWQVVVRLGI